MFRSEFGSVRTAQSLAATFVGHLAATVLTLISVSNVLSQEKSCCTVACRGSVQSVCLSASGDIAGVALYGENSSIDVFSSKTGKRVGTVSEFVAQSPWCFLTSKGFLVYPITIYIAATQDYRGGIRIFDVTNNKVVCEGKQTDSASLTACISTDGSRLATYYSSGEIKVWNLANGDCLATLKNSDASAGLAFVEQGNRLAAVGEGCTVVVWDVMKAVPVGKPTRYEGYGVAVSGMLDEKTAKVMTSRGTVFEVFPDGSCKTLGQVDLGGQPKSGSISSDGRIGAFVYVDTTECFDLTTRKLIRKLDASSGFRGQCCSVSSDGKFVCTGAIKVVAQSSSEFSVWSLK